MIPHILSFALVTLTSLAFGLTVPPGAIENQLAQADLVVDVHIEAIQGVPDPITLSATEATATVLNVVRSSRIQPPERNDSIVIRTPGGEVGGTGVFLSGFPRPYAGQEYRAYLSRQSDSTYTVQGYEQGLQSKAAHRNFSRNRTDGSNGAGTGPYLFWADEYLPIPYYVSITTLFNSPSVIDAIDASFRTWRNVENSRLEYLPMGCARVDSDENDGINAIVLITSDWRFDHTAIAITRNFYVAGDSPRAGMILDSDILLNGVDHDFTTTNVVGRHDIQNIVTHEAGHFIGLGHETPPADPDATMYAVATPNETKKRILHDDDKAGLLAGYGGGFIHKIPQISTLDLCSMEVSNKSCVAVPEPNSSSPIRGILFLVGMIILVGASRLLPSRSRDSSDICP